MLHIVQIIINEENLHVAAIFQQQKKKCKMNLPVPEPFNFDNPESYGVWSKRFQRYLTVSDLNKKSESEKIDILMYIMGPKSEAILLQLKDKPDTVEKTLDSFEKYFTPRTNVIFERFKFNTRNQNSGEPVESFISDLHAMAEKCKFGDLKDELIRDRIVVGLSDGRASEVMQLKSDLTLEMAINIAKQSERQQFENQIIRRNEAPINYVSSGITKNHQTKGSVYKECYFCGRAYHDRKICPAKNATCRNCGKEGHYQKSCKSTSTNTNIKNKNKSNTNQIHNVILERDNYNSNENVYTQKCNDTNENMFIGHIQCYNSLNAKDWFAECYINDFNSNVNFLIDTGASNASIPAELVPLNFHNKLNTNSSACGPDGNPLKVLGSIRLTLSYNNRSANCLVYVIQQLKTPLLGREAIVLLNVLQPPHRISSMNHTDCFDMQNSRDIALQYPKIFNEMGEFKDVVSIKLKEDAKPFVQSVPRPVPIPMMNKLKAEIDRLLSLKIIEPMLEVTDWVAPIVVVQKNDKEIRLCVDYTRLNEYVKRPYYPILKIESTLANLKGARYFSKIDINKGFYQIRLDKTSQLLTCFITPFGRYIFTRLPFGISCAPEHFVSKYAQVLRNIPNVTSHVDDVLIYGHSKEEHDSTLNEVLKRLSDEGITINQKKSVFGVTVINWLGHVLSGKGISIDPDRVIAIKNFPVPENKTQLLRFLGIVNFVGKFIENKSTILEPLYNLLKSDVEYKWNTFHEKSFNDIKNIICNVPVLAYYDPSKHIVISADASSYGIGGCLFQTDDLGNREIVAYVSRTMTSTEKHYAQIEREALGLTWAAEKFSDYITGLHVTLETDHKPLIQILQTKNLDSLTPRLQRFRMRLMRYSYSVVYVPGKSLIVADALSRSPIEQCSEKEELCLELENYVNFITSSLPVKNAYLEKILEAQQHDKICQILKKYTIDGWPNRNSLSSEISLYYQYRFEISCSQNLLMKGSRIIIPQQLQNEVLQFIHVGHQGITKCRRRAQVSVWWLGLSVQLEDLIKNCPTCIEERINIKEPFHRESIPSRPMQKIAVDFFKHKSWNIIITDCYSRYFEIYPVQSMTEDVLISKIKDYFSHYGICDTLRCDSGTQFTGYKFRTFASKFNFSYDTSSPHYHQSNGAVEAAVKTAKRLIKMNDDIDMALLSYRATPLENGFSPGELMMGRRLKTNIPIIPNLLEVHNNRKVVAIENKLKDRSEYNYNKRHNVKTLSKLEKGDSVWVVDLKIYGTIIKQLSQPRSYLIKTDRGVFRRNRWHLVHAQHKENYESDISLNKKLLPISNSTISQTAFSSTNCKNVNDFIPSQYVTEEPNNLQSDDMNLNSTYISNNEEIFNSQNELFLNENSETDIISNEKSNTEEMTCNETNENVVLPHNPDNPVVNNNNDNPVRRSTRNTRTPVWMTDYVNFD